MKKVIHLIPYDGTGGVEIAARSMQHVKCADLDFSVQSIYPHVPGYEERHVTFGIRPLLEAFSRTRRQRPEVLIVSLWRACIVGALVKMARPRLRLVLMLHSTRDAHWLDRLFTRATGFLAQEWWGDSAATVDERLRGSPRKTKRVISFVTRRLEPAQGHSLSPTFIFWGRISAIKGIDRAIRIFSRIRLSHPGARFVIIGPDGGALAELQALVQASGLQESVLFKGEMDMAQICEQAASACFYLQASKYEGMAMSVVEAMQLGLVPVVTPVGEIRNYCRAGHNAILIHSDDAVVDEILGVLADAKQYSVLRQRAVATWHDQPLYADSMLQACRAALDRADGRSSP